LSVVGKPDKSIDMSEPDVAIDAVAVLLPPVPAPPLVSFEAPVVTVTMLEPLAVGVPVTVQEMLVPAATVAGGAGVQVPTLTPGGRPATEQLAFVAAAVAAALFVHLMVPAYAVPTVAVVGRPDRSGVMSDPVVVSVAVAVLLAALESLVAPVVPLTVETAGVVGVPVTVQTICAPGATDDGGTGEHDVERPAGKPVTAQLAAVAVTAGAAAFLHVKEPL
jgi:hypothetical protein